MVTAHVDGGDDVTLPSAPWRFSGATDQAPHELGAFGADNDHVLAELLELDDEADRRPLPPRRPAPRRAPP